MVGREYSNVSGSSVASTAARQELLERWQRNCLRSQIANYDAATFYKRNNHLFGVPTIIISAAVGTSIFAALGTNVNSIAQITVGIFSLLAAVLGALQTFFNWGDLSSKHQSTAAKYGALKRQIDQILAGHASGNHLTDEQLNHIRSQMDTLSLDTPEVPDRIWRRARNKIPTSQPALGVTGRGNVEDA